LFMLWLRPIVEDTRSVSPDADELQRAFDQYGSQLVIRSDTSYNLAPEVFTRAGAVAIAALLMIPLAGFAARRRWAAYVVGGSLAVFAVMLLPFLFTALADLVSISQARRAAGFLPFAFAFAGGMGVLARLVGPILIPLALGAGMFLQIVYPGDFEYVLRNPAPAWIAWFGALGAVAALVVGFVRRRPALETGAAIAAAAFLTPVIGGGLLDWNRPGPTELATLTPGVVTAIREEVEQGSVVFSDPETSFRLAGYAPVYIASAPPGHVADTDENRPYERASDARRFLRTGDLSIPRGYGAEVVVLDRLRTDLELELPVVYEDDRFTIYRL
jgi:xanthosine utilization system XapX-like protein